MRKKKGPALGTRDYDCSYLKYSTNSREHVEDRKIAKCPGKRNNKTDETYSTCFRKRMDNMKLFIGGRGSYLFLCYPGWDHHTRNETMIVMLLS